MTRIRRYLFLPIAAALAAAFWLGSLDSPGYASSPASLTIGSAVIPEADDFATRVIGQPWDMQSAPYPDFFTALKSIDRSAFHIRNDGTWDLKSTDNDPRIWLHWTGVGTTQAVLKMGDSYPIDASKYKLFSFYMCLDKAPSQAPGQDDDWAALLYWMYDRTPHEHPANGYTNFILFKQQGYFKNDGDCEVLTFDLSKAATWDTGAWNNSPKMPMGLRLDPINKPGRNFQIGWARLTTIDPGNKVALSWNNAPGGEVKFYASLTGCNQDGILIGKASSGSGSGTFQWGAQLQPGFSPSQPLPVPASFEPGQYHIYMKDANGGIACGNTPLTIHAAPILEFLKPSFFSGPDYATNVVNDPWGMANSADIASYAGMNSPNINNGILSAVATSSDPRLFMNLFNVIPTSQYRYATFRMKIAGQNSGGNGWVQRFIWWYNGATIDNVTTEDMQVYEGWHTYTIDLKTAGTENCSSNCWSGFPTTLRFDPFEPFSNTTFWLDFLLLTGPDSVIQGNSHSIHYVLKNAPGATVTFYKDTDKNPANGRTPLQQLAPENVPAENPLLGFKAFMPVLNRPGEVNLFLGALTYTWTTASIPEATYYISADVSDGIMTTTWYSDAPVIIK